jgi:UDP-N-acetylglucosamine acyltransferase
MASGAALGGNTRVSDGVNLGANAGVHQFCRLGTMAMVGGLARVRQDVLPYAMITEDNRLFGLNRVGLRRAGHTGRAMAPLKEAYRRFALQRESLKDFLAWLATQPGDPLLSGWREFMSQPSKRGYARGRAAGDTDDSDVG